MARGLPSRSKAEQSNIKRPFELELEPRSAQMPGRSAAHCVVFNSELLRSIFGCSLDTQNASNALVCKAWCDDALNMIWRDLGNPIHLFNLLAPLSSVQETQGHVFHFSRYLKPEDWARFHCYSWRVHHMRIDWVSFDKSFFAEISSTRPLKDLLPNLLELDYRGGPPEFLSLFLTPNLRGLTFYDPEENTVTDRQRSAIALQYLPSRAPNLTTLILFGKSPPDVMEPALTQAIKGLPQLKCITFPCILFTPAVASSLATLPSLEKICISKEDSANLGTGAHLPTGSAEGGFSSLSHLDLKTPYTRVVRWFSDVQTTNVLTSLVLQSIDHESPQMYGQTIQTIAANCPNIRCLRLVRPEGIQNLGVPPETVSITFDHLRHLLDCGHLRRLALSHWSPFNLTTSDFVILVKSLPCLVSLSLNPTPLAHPPDQPFDLSIFPMIVPYCSNLLSLNLYIDASVVPPVNADVPGVFPRLRRLGVGSSPYGPPFQVARFMSAFLPESFCTIVTSGGEQRQKDAWLVVNRGLPDFILARKEERDRHGPFCQGLANAST